MKGMENAYISREILLGLSRFSLKDGLMTRYQMRGRNFAPRLIFAVAHRCKWGAPQVLCCRPTFRGKPFPTTFWLTCPHLSHKCGTLESLGAVGEMQRVLLSCADEYRLYNSAYALFRLSLLGVPERLFMRRYCPRLYAALRDNGIGGIRRGSGPTAKCLHMQTAAMLGLPGHPAESWLRPLLGDMSCTDAACLCTAAGNV